ncbi:hypothetical protein J1605_014111 [Eschrichtius robustus]|uniref:Uncharacterized protein n=1 Tax=Eschrichtius robustus TaxID=9764 RepID=A0AB34GDT0_ESCRO|nr:hypothetical protein J1605_014111 [Eschrichtius robustus]
MAAEPARLEPVLRNGRGRDGRVSIGDILAGPSVALPPLRPVTHVRLAALPVTRPLPPGRSPARRPSGLQAPDPSWKPGRRTLPHLAANTSRLPPRSETSSFCRSTCPAPEAPADPAQARGWGALLSRVPVGLGRPETVGSPGGGRANPCTLSRCLRQETGVRDPYRASRRNRSDAPLPARDLESAL